MKREDYYFAAGISLKGFGVFLLLLFAMAVVLGSPPKESNIGDRAGRAVIFILLEVTVFASGGFVTMTGDDIKAKRLHLETNRFITSAKNIKEWGLKTPEIRAAIKRSQGTGWMKDLSK